ncbi:MAG: DUF4214 domain-containing protein [Aquihabitans sp.]
MSSSGTQVTVNLAGNEAVTFRCTSGKAVIANATSTFTPSPSVNCSALTQVNVTGNSDNQDVDGRGLDAAAFSAKPKLNVGLGQGLDSVTETQNADTIDLGGGSDDLYLQRGLTGNSLIQMGDGALDHVYLTGDDRSTQYTIASSGPNTTLAHDVDGSPAFVWVVQNVEYADVDGGAGDDEFGATDVTAASTLQLLDLDGFGGHDYLAAGSRPTRMNGGSGTNTFDLGYAADEIETESETDTVFGIADAADDQIRDNTSLRFGGRTLTGFGNTGGSPTDTYYADIVLNDAAVRIRPSGGSALVTASLNRTGQQTIPAAIEAFDLGLNTMTELTPRTLADVVVPSQDVVIGSTTGEKELIDITVPAGSWTDTVSSGTRTITTASSAQGDVSFSNGATYRVHGPWTNQNQGFGHRVYRDVLLRFATTAERDAVRDQLANGTRTRAQIVASIMGTDEYRGTDVDRVFLRYLKRATDPGGRTYWINAIEGGRSLRVFRAQLFGSNEYFTKAGGTNASFVERAYEDVLGRKPDPSGLAYWTNKANSGTERGQIARQFLASAEAKRAIVRDQFLRFLDRQPTADEITGWSNTLDTSPNGEQQLVASLASSVAYLNRS